MERLFTPPLQLKGNPFRWPQSIAQFWQTFTEKLVLFNWSSSKNHNSSSQLMLRALLCCVASAIYLFVLVGVFAFIVSQLYKVFGFVDYANSITQFFDPTGVRWIEVLIIPGVITIGAVFWSFKSTYISKWTYCADLYNRILFDDLLVDSKSKKAKLIRAAFVIDILTMELWAHRSFQNILQYVFGEIAEGYDTILEFESIKSDIPQSKADLLELLKAGSLREDVALEIVNRHYTTLVGSSGSKYNNPSQKEYATHAYEVLNFIAGDLVSAFFLDAKIDEYEFQIEKGVKKSSKCLPHYRRNRLRLAISALFRYSEIYRKRIQHLEIDLTEAEKLKSELDGKQIAQFRHVFEHELSQKTDEPHRPESVDEHLVRMEKFFVPDFKARCKELANQVMRIRDAIGEKYPESGAGVDRWIVHLSDV